MINLLELFGEMILISIGIVMGVMLLWFMVGIMVGFWEVYVCKTENEKARHCIHPSSQYTDELPYFQWRCTECGRLHD